MSFLRVTNIQDLNGSNTVAITSASSGNLIVKKELLGESGANFTGVGTINNIQIGAGIITATSGVVTFFGDITPTDINISGAMTATGGFTGDLVGDVTGDLTGNVVGFGVSIVGVGSFSSARIAEGDEGGVTINESGIYLDQLAGVVTATTFDGNLTGNVTGDIEGNTVGQGISIVGVGTFGTVFITGIGITLNESGINVPTGVITATSFDGNFVGTISGDVTGTASSATTLIDGGNILGGTIDDARLPDTITSDITGTATTATNLADGANITTGIISNDRLPSLITSNINIDAGISTFSTVGITTLLVTEVITGIADTANNLADAANITTGTISDDRLPNTITSNIDISTGDSTFNNVTVSGNLVATATTATNLANGANITSGTIDDARLPDTITSNINAVDGSSSFNEIDVTTLTVSGTLTGTATTATNLANGANITTGIIDDARLPATITSNIDISTGDSTFNNVTVGGNLVATATTATTATTLSDAANITTGTIDDARLPDTITSNITASSGASEVNNLTVNGTLTGTATTATNLADAANITTGTIDDARLPAEITSNITAPSGTSVFDNLTVTGTLTGTATTLSDAANITTGTIDDSRLPDTITSNITAPSGTSVFDSLTVTGTLTGTASTLSDAANITTGTINDDRLPDLITSNINVDSGISTVNQIEANGIIFAEDGIITGAGSANAVKITLSGNTLTFTVDGVGSADLTLT